MGVDNQQTLTHAAAIFDDFVERGGTTFDTAYIYGGGRGEKLLGQWITSRGNRDEVVVIGKGAHTPHCDPESITRQLDESLERLQTDHVDLYLMHRDNEEIPVGEFVDVMDEHFKAGRIKAFGGSNWSTARFDEANAYAEASGKQPFTLLSNHLSLARAYDVPWAGCRHVSDDESQAWLRERQVALFPWSSQARGFFTGRAKPEDRSDEELVRCFYSDENFRRLRPGPGAGGRQGCRADGDRAGLAAAPAVPGVPADRAAAHQRDQDLDAGPAGDADGRGSGLPHCVIERVWTELVVRRRPCNMVCRCHDPEHGESCLRSAMSAASSRRSATALPAWVRAR